MHRSQPTLSELIYQIANQQIHFIKSQLKDIQINPMQARIIKYIGLHPGTNQKSIARYFNKYEGTITNILANLEKSDDILRQPAPDNEREKQLYLTDQGQDKLTQIQSVFSQLAETLDQAVPQAHQSIVLEALTQIQQQFNDTNKGGSYDSTTCTRT